MNSWNGKNFEISIIFFDIRGDPGDESSTVSLLHTFPAFSAILEEVDKLSRLYNVLTLHTIAKISKVPTFGNHRRSLIAMNHEGRRPMMYEILVHHVHKSWRTFRQISLLCQVWYQLMPKEQASTWFWLNQA